MIFCLVQGDAIKNSFPIDTRNYATFGHLRIAIKDAKQNAFVGIDADRLTLWRVDIIQTKENQEVIVKEHKGVELHSFESVGSYFQETPTSTNIRIIVEPSPLATTGKCLLMVYFQTINSRYLTILFRSNRTTPDQAVKIRIRSRS